jgi:hypothetical protein
MRKIIFKLILLVFQEIKFKSINGIKLIFNVPRDSTKTLICP